MKVCKNSTLQLSLTKIPFKHELHHATATSAVIINYIGDGSACLDNSIMEYDKLLANRPTLQEKKWD